CPDDGSGRNAWLGTYGHYNYLEREPFFAQNRTVPIQGVYHPFIFLPQDAPNPKDCLARYTQSAHPGVMNVVLADGSVQTISPATVGNVAGMVGTKSLTIWEAMVRPDDT